jgi:hypothetical protein
MQRLQSLILLSITGVVFAAGLTGCSLGGFPEASVNPQQNDLGTIVGNDYGGHAPLVGAHVYVLQPSVTTAAGTGSSAYAAQYNAYGYLATSLLTANSSGNGYNTTQNTSDPGIPTSWYYQKADLTGSFNITGDYTCTVGLPVYLYLYGGSPTFPSGSNTFNISSISVTGTGNPYTVTFTTTTTENAYIGEYVTFSGISGGSGLTALNGTSQVVVAANLTTNTFSVDVTSSSAQGPIAQSGATASFSPTFNPAVVNLAVLGNCPSTGNFTYNPQNPSSTPGGLKYVYVNEVSTVAAAYAFRPFTLSALGSGPPSTLGVNSAIYIGTSSTNIAGIQNAALIAGQLYDVQGSNVSTTYAGEGHIARPMTTNGNGIVPQANIDTIANILAACVDSNNTATTLGSGGTQGTNMSTQCSTLFNYATLSGIPVSGGGTQPYDTATAAINIARHPAGPPYSYSSTGSSSFMSALYSLPTGNVPFTPDLATQPNDFTIGIDYTAANNPGPDSYPLTTGAESLAIDAIGNVWFTTQPNKGSGAGYLSEVNPVGVFNASTIMYNSSYIYGYVAIDSGESAWAGSAISSNPITYVHATSTPAAVAGSAPPTYSYATGSTNSTLVENYTYAPVATSAGSVYFGNNKTSGSSSDYVETFSGAATTPTVTGTESAALTGVSTDANGFSHAAADAAGDAYFDYNAASGNGTPTVTRVALSSGATASGFPVTNSTTGCTSMVDPEQMAVTRSGDIIVPDYNNGSGSLNSASSSLYYITSAGVCTQLSGATLEAGLNSPFGAVVDGNDYVYITNRGGSSITVLNTQAASASGTTAVSPSTGYEPQYLVGNTLTPELSGPLNIASDPSGNLWITDYGNNSIVEIIGLAFPTTTPLANAAIPISYTQGSIGYRP